MLSCLAWAGGLLRGISILGLTYLEWIGLIVTLAVILYQTPQYINAIYVTWIVPIFGLYVDLRKMGRWAVVTGASDGIGKAYAEEIARSGVNVVLISRSKDKLDEVANGIEKLFEVETKVIVADFTQGLEVYEKVEKELEGLEIGTLVNNIGIWYPYVERFTELPNARKHSQDMIFCNVFPITFLTHMILPQMCSRQRGVIINVGSMSSLAPVPLMSMYSATKAFTERFSESLAMEYEKEGVIIQVVIPAYVSTRMSRVSKPSWTSPSTTEYVQKALKTVGIEHRTAVHIPHRLSMRAMEWYFYFIPGLFCRGTLNAALTLRTMSKRRREEKNKSK